MLVSDIMTKIVHTIDSEDTVEQVQQMFEKRHLSSMPVVDSSGVVFGIISAADLLHFQAMGKNAKAVRAWDMCTYKPLEVRPDTPVPEVARLMIEKRIHHVIVSENAQVKGFVSSLDIIRQYLSVIEEAPASH
jgi:CBS domain-containing protein